jgi:hypothetical protein
MPAKLQILTDKGSFDLEVGTDERFYVTRQIHDLHNFETKNGDYTKTLTVPSTPTNNHILDAYVGASGNTKNVIPCQIIMDGITVASQARLLFTRTLITNQEIVYEITILYGNSSFFESIVIGTIDEMNWADLAYDNTETEYVTNSENTTGLVTPLCDWVTRDSLPVAGVGVLTETSFEINVMGFFIYAKEIIERIIVEAGFSLVVASNVPSDFTQVALACPVTKFFEYTDLGQVNFASYVANVSDQTANGVTARLAFTVVGSDTQSQWQVDPTNEWLIAVTGEIRVVLRGVYDINNGTLNLPPSRFDIYQNLILIASFDMSQIDAVDVDFYLAVDITAIAGDVIYTEIVASPGGQSDIATLQSLAQFQIITPGTDVDREVQPSNYIPQINKNDFIANILKLFNLVMRTNDISKVVTIQPFDDIYTAPEQDLTRYLDAGTEEITISNSISSLGQHSFFKWQEDDLIRRDSNTDIDFPNQLLAKEKTVIEMEFSACDNSLLHFSQFTDTYLKAKIPSATIVRVKAGLGTPDITIASDGTFAIGTAGYTWQIGSWFRADDGISIGLYRVVEKFDDVSGKVETPIEPGHIGPNNFFREIITATANDPEPRLAIIRSDGSEISYLAQQGTTMRQAQFTADSLTANWMDSLKMENITSVNYQKILSALQAPEVTKAWFNIPTALFVQIDLLKPVYVATFNGTYYINKINQFRPDQKVQIELVRISNFE